MKPLQEESTIITGLGAPSKHQMMIVGDTNLRGSTFLCERIERHCVVEVDGTNYMLEYAGVEYGYAIYTVIGRI